MTPVVSDVADINSKVRSTANTFSAKNDIIIYFEYSSTSYTIQIKIMTIFQTNISATIMLTVFYVDVDPGDILIRMINYKFIVDNDCAHFGTSVPSSVRSCCFVENENGTISIGVYVSHTFWLFLQVQYLSSVYSYCSIPQNEILEYWHVHVPRLSPSKTKVCLGLHIRFSVRLLLEYGAPFPVEWLSSVFLLKHLKENYPLYIGRVFDCNSVPEYTHHHFRLLYLSTFVWGTMCNDQIRGAWRYREMPHVHKQENERQGSANRSCEIGKKPTGHNTYMSRRCDFQRMHIQSWVHVPFFIIWGN